MFDSVVHQVGGDGIEGGKNRKSASDVILASIGKELMHYKLCRHTICHFLAGLLNRREACLPLSEGARKGERAWGHVEPGADDVANLRLFLLTLLPQLGGVVLLLARR
jgi:hypothetical protein